jgi:hypothetical protein
VADAAETQRNGFGNEEFEVVLAWTIDKTG